MRWCNTKWCGLALVLAVLAAGCPDDSTSDATDAVRVDGAGRDGSTTATTRTATARSTSGPSAPAGRYAQAVPAPARREPRCVPAPALTRRPRRFTAAPATRPARRPEPPPTWIPPDGTTGQPSSPHRAAGMAVRTQPRRRMRPTVDGTRDAATDTAPDDGRPTRASPRAASTARTTGGGCAAPARARAGAAR